MGNNVPGTQKRDRVFVAPKWGGKANQPYSEARHCNAHACPIDCVVAAKFDAWSTCTKSCGTGAQFRMKALTEPINGGKECPTRKHASVYETRPCNAHLCPVDCVVSGWAEWGTCSVECGPGIKARTRTISTSPKHGGKRCPDLVDEMNCQGPKECPIDCIYEWKPWTPCTKTCGAGNQERDLVVTTWARHDGVPCPTRQDRVCNAHVCPTPAPTPAPTPDTPFPTPAPTPRPFSKPIIQVLQGDDLHIEATTEDNYVDAGATCSDLIDGNLNRFVRVSGDVVNLAVPGAYHIKYDCVNHESEAAFQAVRVVYVEDNTCPVCTINAGPQEIEASFPYADPGVQCYDSVDGAFKSSAIVVAGLPDVEQTGSYTITYRVKDAAGNWNDGRGTNCRGAAQYKRVVEVVDSLKPVLALHLASKTIQMSDEVDERVPGSAGSSPKPNSSPNAAQKGRVPLATMVQDANGNWAPAAKPYRPTNPMNGAAHPAMPVV